MIRATPVDVRRRNLLDGPAIEWLAHAVRGTSANFGARLLPESCGRLERLAAGGDLNGAADVASLDNIETELERVGAALRHEFSSPT